MNRGGEVVDVAYGSSTPGAPAREVATHASTGAFTRHAKRTLIHECQRCGRRFDHGFTPRCLSCQGLVEVIYDLESVQLYDSFITSQRFADLLPICDRANLLFLGEGNTPCVHAGRLGESLGLDRLYLKVESANPSGTTKDRMAAIVLSLFKELGVREFISSSTGNSSSALARGIELYPRFVMHLYVGGAFSDRVRFGAGNAGVHMHVMENMSFSDSFNHAKSEAARLSLPFEAGFFNPARREGLKLAYFEAVEEIPTAIDWCVQAVSSAMGTLSIPVLTWAVACRPATIASGYRRIMGLYATTSTRYRALRSDVSPAFFEYAWRNDDLSQSSYHVGANGVAWYVLVVRDNAGLLDYWINGVRGAQQSYASGVTTPTAFAIGSGASGSAPFSGHIAMAATVSSALADAECAAVSRWMGDCVGVPA